MRGIPYKCDVCGTINLIDDGTTNGKLYKKSIYSVIPPQIKIDSEPTENSDICSRECLLRYAEQQLMLG
jgi:hypothetical protein